MEPKDEWDKIPIDYIIKPYAYIPKILETIIKLKGLYTKH